MRWGITLRSFGARMGDFEICEQNIKRLEEWFAADGTPRNAVTTRLHLIDRLCWLRERVIAEGAVWQVLRRLQVHLPAKDIDRGGQKGGHIFRLFRRAGAPHSGLSWTATSPFADPRDSNSVTASSGGTCIIGTAVHHSRRLTLQQLRPETITPVGEGALSCSTVF